MTSPQSDIECIDESDPAIDFCNLNVRLARPSDHGEGVGNPYAPPARSRHLSPRVLAQRFLNDPVTSTLSGFSRIACHFNASSGWDPEEEYDNVIDLITSRDSTAFLNERKSEEEEKKFRPPPPALPLIPSSVPQSRLQPLITQQFYLNFTDKPNIHILERVFRGGIGDNELRRKLWPLILGLTDDWRKTNWESLEPLYDHYENQWKSILPDQEDRFTAYRERKSILERDVVRCDRTHPFYSLNCDKSTEHLEQLRRLLMTYVMFDFDTGYVQGMTDLASPLLYVWEGDVKKAFWTFVKVMEFFKNNFEMSQKTISYQLKMLWKLINISDPCFGSFLASKESDNCYFAFRWIICQFKREFMKAKTDDYHDCLIVWETVWTATAIARIKRMEKASPERNVSKVALDGKPGCDEKVSTTDGSVSELSSGTVCDGQGFHEKKQSMSRESNDLDKESVSVDGPTENVSKDRTKNVSVDRTKNVSIDRSKNVSLDRSESPQGAVRDVDGSPHFGVKSTCVKLNDTEMFTLCLCLSIIRRERDLIFANDFDACEILKHFNTLNLNDDLNNILLHALNIWHWIKNDGGEEQLHLEEDIIPETEKAIEAAEDFDLLNDDFMMISTLNV